VSVADCNETIRELHTYLDGELPDDLHAAIHLHLDGCTDCLQTFEFHLELQAAIRRKCSNDPMPAGLADRIRQCFDADFEPPSGRAGDGSTV
jgi:mycothiol system anti-sigma-R factor